MYPLLVDNYSHDIDVIKCISTTLAAIIQLIKSIFDRHEIPEELVFDNWPQFSVEEFVKLAREYGFYYTPTSPKFPQANGEAKRQQLILSRLYLE